MISLRTMVNSYLVPSFSDWEIGISYEGADVRFIQGRDFLWNPSWILQHRADSDHTWTSCCSCSNLHAYSCRVGGRLLDATESCHAWYQFPTDSRSAAPSCSESSSWWSHMSWYLFIHCSLLLQSKSWGSFADSLSFYVCCCLYESRVCVSFMACASVSVLWLVLLIFVVSECEDSHHLNSGNSNCDDSWGSHDVAGFQRITFFMAATFLHLPSGLRYTFLASCWI